MEAASADMKRVRNASAALRILVVRVGAMGDVLHGMPAVAALRTALPDAVIGWAIEPRWAPLLCAPDPFAPWKASLPLVDAVHLVETRKWSKQPLSFATWQSVRALRYSLRSERYDIAIDLQGSIRSALIAKGSGATRVIGSARPRETPARWFYDERALPVQPHVVDQAAEIVSAAVNMPLQAAHAPLPIDADAEAWCTGLLAQDPRPVVFLSPTAGWGAKQWPAVRYGELARELAGQRYRVLVNASPSGVDAVAAEVLQTSNNTAHMVPCTLPQLIALLRRVDLLVAGDSGPLHLAAALQRPVVALFGPTDPVRNGPYATRSAVLRHPDSSTDHRRHAPAEAGLLKISVPEVLALAQQLLR